MSQPFSLSEQQIRFYWDNGYLIVKKLFDIPTLNMFRDRFVELVNSPNVSQFVSIVKDPKLMKINAKPEMYINKIQDILYDEVFSKYSEDPTMLHILSQLIGDDITVISCMLINKPPGSDRHSTHQDIYYFPIRPADKIIASWTAIDPVYIDNGSLFVIPGSHKAETLYIHGEKATEKKDIYLTIESEDIVAPAEKRVYLEMEPGDTVFFHPYLLHGSGDNVSQNYRKAITAHYTNSGCHYIDVRGTPQERLKNIIEEALKRRGATFDFIGMWQMKSKQVKRARSHL